MNGSADVIVTGAGPAGSMAAAVLARAGVNVLLVDREPFPRAKACGDVVPAGCFLELRKIGISSRAFDSFPVSQVLLQGPAHTERRFGLEAQQGLSTGVLSRSIFDHTLVQYAQACGAHFAVLNVRGPILDGTRDRGHRQYRLSNRDLFQPHRDRRRWRHVVDCPCPGGTEPAG